MNKIFVFIVSVIIVIIVFIVRCIYIRCRRDDHKYRTLYTNRGEYDNDIHEVWIPTSNTLDLHEMKVKDAKSELKRFLRKKEQERKRCNGGMTLTIITGKGNHSPHGHPVLKPVVMNYLEKNGYKYNVDPKNTGRLFVQLP